MANFKFGDIVLLTFPFTGLAAVKKRPAMVLKDTDDGDFIVCRITSQSYYSAFDVKVADWKSYGLKLPSTIRLHKIASLEKKMAEKVIGRLDNNLKLSIRKVIYSLLS